MSLPHIASHLDHSRAMDFLTIYQNDYLWPPRPPTFPRSELTCSIAGPVRDPVTAGNERHKACGCRCDGSDDDDGEVEAERSRVVIRKCPKTVKIEYVGEEDDCLTKLLKKPRKSDALKKYNQERLKSTYQADFDHLDNPPIPTCPTTSTTTSSKSPTQSSIECRNPIRSHRELMRLRRGGRAPQEIPGVPPCHDRSGRMSLRKRRRAAAPPDYERNVLPHWSSEYRDAIGKVGAEILVEGKMSRRAKNRRRMRMALRAGADDGTMRL